MELHSAPPTKSELAFAGTLRIIEGDAILGLRSKATVTIHNSKPQVKLVARPGDESPVIGVFEVSDGPVRPAFDLIRSGDRDQPATINVEFFPLSAFPESPTGGVAAVPGRDFTPVTNRIDFSPGQSKASLQIPIIENTRVDERDRYFGFRMTSPTPGLELVPSKEVTIIIKADVVPATLDDTRDPNRYSEPIAVFQTGASAIGNYAVELTHNFSSFNGSMLLGPNDSRLLV